MTTTIGAKIKALRDEKGYSLDDLADRAKCSKSYVWELENKSPPRPSASKLADIARALEVPMDYFIDDEAPAEDAVDRGFYRKYQKMDAATKKKIRKMVDLWDEG